MHRLPQPSSLDLRTLQLVPQFTRRHARLHWIHQCRRQPACRTRTRGIRVPRQTHTRQLTAIIRRNLTTTLHKSIQLLKLHNPIAASTFVIR